jgi:peptidoglycan/LPS O-acetylase OafA/YrhL
MWARIIEFMLACWLAISPFLFGYTPEQTPFFVNDFICAFLMGVFSLGSYFHSVRKLHLLNLAISLWLLLVAFWIDPKANHLIVQNYTVVGLLLFMLAIVPSSANDPPYSWQKFYKME